MERKRSIYGTRWVCRCETGRVVRLLENGARCDRCGTMQMWLDIETKPPAFVCNRDFSFEGIMDGLFERPNAT